MKIILFGSKYNKIDNLFHPLFDQGNKIIGTQWLAGSFNLSLENFKTEDFQFQNEIAKSEESAAADEVVRDLNSTMSVEETEAQLNAAMLASLVEEKVTPESVLLYNLDLSDI